MMRVICLLLVFRHVYAELPASNNWDLAVAHNNQIDVLVANGTVLDTIHSFMHLKALTFDNKRHQLITSDMNEEKDTIYATQLKNEDSDMITIIKDIPDDIQGLVHDPETDILYWTDPIGKSIKYIMLNDTIKKSNTFVQFDREKPQDLVIHSCKRYIYFTNSYSYYSSINKLHLDTRSHEVLIDTNLHTAVGITIDYVAERLYWSNWGPGIYFRIESANLDGEDRETVIGSTYQQPLGLAVDIEFIYWTDINNNALWRYQKSNTCKYNGVMQQLMSFDDRPHGLVTKYLGVAGTPNCEEIIQLKKDKLTVEYETNLYCKKVEDGKSCPKSVENEPSCETSKYLDHCAQENCDFKNRYS